MANLKTNYMGLELKNPIIVGSSELTNSVDKIKKLEDNNAAAVVLKSLFEEQILLDINKTISENITDYPGAQDFIHGYTKNHKIDEYLKLIEDAKKAVKIPVIASINCVSESDWTSYATKIEEAGADAIELNIAVLPSSFKTKSTENEDKYFKITRNVREKTKLPLSLKMSYFSAGLANLIQKMDYSNYVDSFVLFNRFYSPDIDVDNLKVTSSNTYSSPAEITTSLRWIAILSETINKNLVASTGIHDGTGVIKQILAGASAVQIVSAIYNRGPKYLNSVVAEIENWMNDKKFASIDDFKGKLSYAASQNTAVFERTQFMKYYSGIKY